MAIPNRAAKTQGDLMFSNKKKYAQESQERASDIAQFNQRYADIQKIADPMDKLEGLLALRKDVKATFDKTVLSLASDLSAKTGRNMSTGLFGGIGGGALTLLFIEPFSGLALMTAGVLSVPVTAMMSGRMIKKTIERAQGYLNGLSTLAATAQDDIEVVLKAHTNDIAASPKFDKLYDNYPEVQKSFIKAFSIASAKKTLEQKPAPVAPKKKPPTPPTDGFSLD